MAPSPPTSGRMKGQTSQNLNIQLPKFKRPLVSRKYGEIFYPDESSRIMELELTVKSLEADVGRDFATKYCWEYHNCTFRVENEELKRKVDFYSDKIESKQAESVELKKEIEKLMGVYLGQQQKNEELEELLKGNMANQPGPPTYSFM